MDTNDSVRIIDVRPRTEFGICQLPGSLSTSQCLFPVSLLISFLLDIPLSCLLANPLNFLSEVDKPMHTFVVCRLGNDSQIAADALRDVDSSVTVKDLVGGLRAWAKDVDSQFPVY